MDHLNFLKEALLLWRQEKAQRHRGTTLQRRLLLFFICVTMAIVLLFAALLFLFGIDGRSDAAIHDYLQNELTDLSQEAEDTFGRLSLQGIALAESLSESCSEFLEEEDLSATVLQKHPELLEPLLSQQMDTLLFLINNNTCSGVYMMLDATVNPAAETADTAKAGIFIKKTLPVAVQSMGSENHYLRGPAQIGRDHSVELLGQWKMEFDISGQEFFTQVMDEARAHPELPLSRLYYWSKRTLLKDNSESGSLLCVPIRTEDDSVIGVCGIELSDRMFKNLYSPTDSDYPYVFSMTAPIDAELLHAHWGFLAGNHYLTAPYIEEDLTIVPDTLFTLFESEENRFGGLYLPLRLYPSGSVFEEETWGFAVMMPQDELESAASGNKATLIWVILGLLLLSLLSSFVISRR